MAKKEEHSLGWLLFWLIIIPPIGYFWLILLWLSEMKITKK